MLARTAVARHIRLLGRDDGPCSQVHRGTGLGRQLRRTVTLNTNAVLPASMSDDLNIMALAAGTVIGILLIGLLTGTIGYRFIGWLTITIVWWSTIAFAAGVFFAFGIHVVLRAVDPYG